MQAFVAVAQAGGFSAASRALGVPLATVSRKVGELEAALGVRLLDDLRDADESVSGEHAAPRGELTITAPAGFGRLHVQPVVLEFLQAFPDIDVPAEPDALTVHRCILWASLGAQKAWSFRVDGQEVLVSDRVRLTTTLPESAIEAAQAGLGLTQVTSYQAESALRSGALVPVLRAFESLPTPVSLVHPSNRRVPRKLRVFLDFAAPRLAARFSSVEQAL
jgi:DNA-binding transcriptional LysR family regulator